jgi:hypothetical protein
MRRNRKVYQTFHSLFLFISYHFPHEQQNQQMNTEYHTALVYAGVQPAENGDEDYDAYMRQEHLAQMSKEPGWRRTNRYKLEFQIKGAEDAAAEAKSGVENLGADYLALYEFDETNELGLEVKACVPMTDWTKRMFTHAKKTELGVWHKIGSFP